MKKTVIYLLFVIANSQFAFCQTDSITLSNWSIKPSINTGFIMIHRSTIGHLVKGYPTFYELDLVKHTHGNKLWHLENNKPDIGLSFQFIDLKNPAQLGHAICVAPFIDIPFNVKPKVSRLIMRICWGTTYITKKFDVTTNQKDIAIGSHLNAFVQFKWFWHLQLSKNLRFEPGITFSHASNGKSANPNLGLNVLSLNAGLNIALPHNKANVLFKSKIDSSTQVKSKNEILTYFAMGLNQKGINTPKLRTHAFSVAYQRNFRNTHKFSVGIDFFYDELYHIDYENSLRQQPTGIDKFRVSAKLGYSYNIGRISIPIELGYYLVDGAKPDAPIVSRLAVRYYSKCGLVGQFGLRTHFAVAYNFEYGLGYRFFIGKK
ncbi:MAG: acyloxyacyl hydrolase [Bacteroidota bacterium]|nr:acyloxyacyl hydrolase [Bacteroidota bacterium]